MSVRDPGRELRSAPFPWGPILIFIGAWAIGVLTLYYTRGSGEHDTFMMAAGIARAARSGRTTDTFLYAHSLQFLFYRVFIKIAAAANLGSGEVLRVMNAMGATCSLAFPALFWALLRQTFPRPSQASLGALILVTSPMYYFMLAYGHPFHLALLSSMLAGLACFRSIEQLPSAKGWSWAAATVLLESAALMFRFEAAMLFWCVVIALVSYRSKARPLLRCSLAVAELAGAIAFFLAARALLVDGGRAEGNFLKNFSLLGRLWDPGAVAWALPYWLGGVGVPLLVATALCVLWGAWARNWRVVFAVVVGVLPTFVLYLGNPSPPRHYYMAVLGCAAVISSCARFERSRWLYPGAALLLLINLVVPWFMRPGLNVIERTRDNQRQIEAAFPFYDQVFGEAGRPVVVIGWWVHVAQLSCAALEHPATRLDRVIVAGVPTFRLANERFEVYLVEAYDAATIRQQVERMRRVHRDWRFLNLDRTVDGWNDLDIEVPASIKQWYSATPPGWWGPMRQEETLARSATSWSARRSSPLSSKPTRRRITYSGRPFTSS